MPPRRGAILALATLAGLAACGESERPDDELRPARAEAVARLVHADEAIRGAHLPTLDLATMLPAEIEAALDAEAACTFRYTTGGRPALAFAIAPDGRVGPGVVKLNGNLVPLAADPEAEVRGIEGGTRLSAGAVRVGFQPVEEPEDGQAEVVLEVGDALRAGYRGFYRCGG